MILDLLTCLALLAGAVAPTPHGVKITVRYNFSQGDGPAYETTEYVQLDRKRFEYKNQGGPRTASITRCDLGRVYEVNLDDHHYYFVPLPEYPTLEELRAAAKRSPTRAVVASPTRLIETTTVDTGERRTIFGHVARHVITTSRQVPLHGQGDHAGPNDGNDDISQTVTDGWYIDLDMSLTCDPSWRSTKGHAFLTVVSYGRVGELKDVSPPDVPAFKDIGTPETGHPLQTTTTIRSTFTLPDGTRREQVSTFDMQVTELTEGPLDPSLFEPPADFHHDWTVSLQAAVNYTWQRLTASVARLFH